MKHATESPARDAVRVGDIPSSVETFDISTTGIEVGLFFENYPDAPGVIISKDGIFFFAITQNDFLRAIGRQFGSELFNRRPIQSVIDYLRNKPMLMLPPECTIHEAMDRCLARPRNEIFDPFLVTTENAVKVKMVDFQSLTLASTRALAARNQQLADEMKERQLLEQKLLRAQRMETVGMLAGGVAHNLNNTLAPILMASSMLQRELAGQIHGEYMQIIGDSARRAADIVEQLMSFSRGMGAKQSTFAPQSLIGEVEKFIRMTFPTSISISTRYGKDLYNLTGDQARLHQVLLNLCINARHAMPNSGELKIAAENCEIGQDDELLPAGVTPGRYIKLIIRDSGFGIAPDIIDKIFDPFFTTKAIGKGTGLGLSTAIGIVRSHEGFIKVTSELGRGTTFAIFLPGTEKPVDDGVCKHSSSSPQGNGELILVADDEAHILTLAETILKENGYAVMTASNGYEALSTYGSQRRKIDLILTDITMPVMNGVELTRLLKKENPKAKIIVSSGKIDRSDEYALRSVGVNERLWKPYGADQLLQVIHDKIHSEVPDSALQASLS